MHQQERKTKHFNMFKKQIKLLKIFKETKRSAILTSHSPSTQVLKDTTGPETKNTTRTELRDVLEMVMEKLIVNMEDWKSCDQRTSTLPSSRVSTEIKGKPGEIFTD